MRLWIVVTLAGLLTAPLLSSAQEVAPSHLVPPAEAFGNGWRLETAEDGDTSQWPSFERFTAAIYLGPNGSRALVGVIAADPTAFPDAWTLASGMFDEYLERINPNFSNEGQLTSQPPVDGCSSMRRIEGSDEVIPAIPVGMSLCATETGEIVFVYVSGELDGLISHQAADRIISLVLDKP